MSQQISPDMRRSSAAKRARSAFLIVAGISGLGAIGCQTPGNESIVLTGRREPLVESMPEAAPPTQLVAQQASPACSTETAESAYLPGSQPLLDDIKVRTVNFDDVSLASPDTNSSAATNESLAELIESSNDEEVNIADDAEASDNSGIVAAAPMVETPYGVSQTSPQEDYPIDLTTALQLAGANHLQIALATERVRESAARLDQAKVLWVPSINAGIGYNRHDGPIQDTRGEVVDVGRQSLYFGGGPAIGSSPLSGGSGGPARLFVDLATADILFEPLAARQNLCAETHARRATQNDNILQVGLTYQELVRAYLQVDIATEAIQNASELVDLTSQFEKAGEGLAADTQRARAELQQRLHQRAGALERVAVNSAELARLLRLGETTGLYPVETQPLPIELVSTDTPIEALVAQGLSQRPELAEHRARVAEAITRIKQEHWRPWLPHLFAGYAGAGFGGGRNSDMENFGVRGDLDLLAVWQVRNLGLGNRALQRERSSQRRQAQLQYTWIRDQVIAEVAQAYSRARYRKEQMQYAEQQVVAAADALPLNFKGIRDDVIRPIEAQQAIAALAAARNLYLAAVIDFNQAQLELVRALGDPPQG